MTLRETQVVPETAARTLVATPVPACGQDVVFTGVAGSSPITMMQFRQLMQAGADEEDLLARNPIICSYGQDHAGLTGLTCRGLRYFTNQRGRAAGLVLGFQGVQIDLDTAIGRYTTIVWVEPTAVTCLR